MNYCPWLIKNQWMIISVKFKQLQIPCDAVMSNSWFKGGWEDSENFDSCLWSHCCGHWRIQGVGCNDSRRIPEFPWSIWATISFKKRKRKDNKASFPGSNCWQRKRKKWLEKRKDEEEQKEVNQVIDLLQAIRSRVKTVCKGRSWLLAEWVKIMDSRNSMIKENRSVIIVVSMVILQLNVGKLITVTTLDNYPRKMKILILIKYYWWPLQIRMNMF